MMGKNRCRYGGWVMMAALGLLVLAPTQADAQGRRGRGNVPTTPTLGLEQGFLEFDTPDFHLKLVKASQTIAAMEPKGAAPYIPSPQGQRRGRRGAPADAAATPTPAPTPIPFDFTPADQLTARATDGYYHLGDLTLRVRTDPQGPWRTLTTAAARKPVTPLAVEAPALAAADLSPTLPEDSPVAVTRTWTVDGGRLVLKFDIKNKTDRPLQIGSLGLPVVFNNMINDFVNRRSRTLEQAHEICTFADPAICQDAGYLQVTRLNGRGPALVVVPYGKTPFEAYQLLREPTAPQQTFEGAFEWLVHTQAYAENEWSQAQPWNPPSMATLAPGESRTYGLKFLVAPEIRDIEKTLADAGRPVAVGIPGYILPTDLDGRLFLKYGSDVQSVNVEPAGAIDVRPLSPTPGGWKQYALQGKGWGRARLTVRYADGTDQVINYYLTKPMAQAVADMGNFLFTRAWYVNPDDPFKRSPSIMNYNRQTNRVVEQDARVWHAGLQDEGGAGAWLAATMKLFGQPTKEELDKFQQFVDGVLWGGIQYSEGPLKYGVRKSLFYYGLEGYPYDPNLNWTTWTSWDKAQAEAVNRAYNYPHVVAAYWSMYQIARNTVGLVTNHPWDWYLNQAYETMMFLTNPQSRVGYVNTGLMGGDVFLLTLQDMKREGWTEKVANLEAAMRPRVNRWVSDPYPFGSEMAWDSTGQEEVFAWTKYFGYEDKALVSLGSILGYMPTVPHWGYNGNARRYWDFIYGGAPGRTSRIERQIHHYGSGINAIPALTQYREHPDDFYLLRIGYGGAMGAISSIDQEGFPSCAFHSFPDTLRWDHYIGDYGPNFLGHALNTAAYLVNHPEFGWQAFGGNVSVEGDRIKMDVRDSFRKRVYVAPRGLYLTLDAGQFESVELDARTGAVRVTLAPATPHMPQARLRIEQPYKPAGAGTYKPAAAFTFEREGYTIPLGSSSLTVELTDRS